MRILLILPRDQIYYYKGFLKNSIGYAPITLAVLAALVPKELEAQIDIVDEGVQKGDYGSKFYDVVGITCVASSSPRAYALAAEFRAKGSHVVLGGAHPTLVPDEALIHGDTVMVGPGEITWPQFLMAFKAGTAQRLYEHVWEPAKEVSMPIPRWDLQPRGLYMNVPTVIANRGCNNKCAFCTINHLYRTGSLCRPIDEVIDEIRVLKTRKVLFLDPSPNSDRDYALKFYTALKPLKLNWMGLTTSDVVDDPELFQAMVTSGCSGVLIGLESFTQANNTKSYKGFNQVSRYKEIVNQFHVNKISVLGHFIIGFDGDTKESLHEMLDIVDDLGIDLPRFTIMTPFPGTGFYDQMKAEGRILTDDMALYDTEHAVFQPKNMTPEELRNIYLHMKKEAYSYKRIWKRTMATPHNRLLTFSSNIGFRFLQNDNVLLALITNVSLKLFSLFDQHRRG